MSSPDKNLGTQPSPTQALINYNYLKVSYLHSSECTYNSFVITPPSFRELL